MCWSVGYEHTSPHPNPLPVGEGTSFPNSPGGRGDNDLKPLSGRGDQFFALSQGERGQDDHVMYHALANHRKRHHPALNQRRGAIVLFLLVSLAVLLGVSALALNSTWLGSYQVQLHQACQAAAMAGAAELLDPTAGLTPAIPDAAAQARIAAATEQARLFFAPNSNTTLQLTGPNTDIIAGWSNEPTDPYRVISRWTGTGPVNSLSVRAVRRRSAGQAVTVWFGNLFGTGDAQPAAAAVAFMDQRVYGFRPLSFVPIPMVPLMAPADIVWPRATVGVAPGQSDGYAVAPKTGIVTTAPDQIAEITLYAPLGGGSVPSGQTAAQWLQFPTTAANFNALTAQVREGIEDIDLQGIGGQIALGAGNTYSIPAGPQPDVAQADQLVAALLAIRGKPRIWPIGDLITVGGQPTCRITGFVGGCVVDCTRNDAMLSIVVQASTIQTCTALLQNGTARNPWIGKLFLNE